LKIVWTEKAEKQLAEIEAYIRQDSERAARNTVLRLIRKTNDQLTRFPGSGKPGRMYGTRELYFSDIPYLVVYKADKETVTVIVVFHVAQNLNLNIMKKVCQ